MSAGNERFLLSCIDNMDSGTINWTKVADQCNMPSSGAASIRYRRMKKKFANASSEDSSGEANSKKISQKDCSPKKHTTPKKRKLADVSGDKANKDDDASGSGEAGNIVFD